MNGRCVDCFNRNSVALVHWPKRGEGPYFMCAMCAWHSVKNRGADLAGLPQPDPVRYLIDIERFDRPSPGGDRHHS